MDKHLIFEAYKKLKENAIVGTTNSITKQGQPSAMKQGTLKLVDKQGQTLGTYQFRNGGGGRGFIPGGEYTVTGREPLAASDVRPMTVGRVGYKYRVRTTSGNPSIPDPRYGEPRSGILIHPDGNVPGTMGCIGIVGDENVQADFVQKMDYLIQQGGGKYTFKFDPDKPNIGLSGGQAIPAQSTWPQAYPTRNLPPAYQPQQYTQRQSQQFPAYQPHNYYQQTQAYQFPGYYQQPMGLAGGIGNAGNMLSNLMGIMGMMGGQMTGAPVGALANMAGGLLGILPGIGNLGGVMYR